MHKADRYNACASILKVKYDVQYNISDINVKVLVFIGRHNCYDV